MSPQNHDLHWESDLSLEKVITQELQNLVGSDRIFVRCAYVSAQTSAGAKALERQMSVHLKKEVKNALLCRGVLESEFSSSTTHTVVSSGNEAQAWVLVIGVGGVGHPVRVGVDVEWSRRPFHPRLETRILSAEEKALGLGCLEAWVIKESAYKAFPDRENTVISQYYVSSWDSSSGKGELRLPKKSLLKCDFTLLKSDLWTIALARVSG
jgi:hypothetical protein